MVKKQNGHQRNPHGDRVFKTVNNKTAQMAFKPRLWTYATATRP
jgi:hypothetical protein